MPHTVTAIFENESQANQARSELINLGVPNGNISLSDDSQQAQSAGSKRLSVGPLIEDLAERAAQLLQRFGALDIQRETDTRMEQLAAEATRPHQHPHLETLDDDPFIGQSTDQQK